jgi:hypothetical protein
VGDVAEPEQQRRRSHRRRAGSGSSPGAPNKSLSAPDVRPRRPLYAAAPECGLCVWTPLPGGAWSLKSLNRSCRHTWAVFDDTRDADAGGPPAVAAPPRFPRCPVSACPVRFRGGPDRLCAVHLADEVTMLAPQALASITAGQWHGELPAGPAELPAGPAGPGDPGEPAAGERATENTRPPGRTPPPP